MKKLVLILCFVLFFGLVFAVKDPPEQGEDPGDPCGYGSLWIYFDDQKADGYYFELDENIAVNGRTKCNSCDCGATETKIQWCEGIGCGEWKDVNSSSGKIAFVQGSNPVSYLNLTAGNFYDINWTIKITEQGIYELRIRADSTYTSATATNPTYRTIYNSYSTQTSIDNNREWQEYDANLHLTCLDVNAADCNTSYYRIDENPRKDVNYGEWTEYDENILVSQDGNIGIQYYSVDLNSDAEPTKNGFALIDKTQHSLLTQNFLPNPSNAAKNFVRLVDENYSLSYCYNSGSNFGDAYFMKSFNGLNWGTSTKINSDAGYCNGNYSETGQEPFRTGEGGITATTNSLNDLIFLFTEWNSVKAWTKIWYADGNYSNTTLISDTIGNNPNKDTINIVADSNDSIHYIITQKTK